jgi:hypothetical protein
MEDSAKNLKPEYEPTNYIFMILGKFLNFQKITTNCSNRWEGTIRYLQVVSNKY